MTNIRAKEFVKRGISTSLQLVEAGYDTIRDILIQSLPYESAEMFHDASSTTSNSKATVTATTTITTNFDRLAQKILSM